MGTEYVPEGEAVVLHKTCCSIVACLVRLSAEDCVLKVIVGPTWGGISR